MANHVKYVFVRDMFILIAIWKLTLKYGRPPLQRELMNFPKMSESPINYILKDMDVPLILVAPLTSVGQFTGGAKSLKECGFLESVRGYVVTAAGALAAQSLVEKPPSEWATTYYVNSDKTISPAFYMPELK